MTGVWLCGLVGREVSCAVGVRGLGAGCLARFVLEELGVSLKAGHWASLARAVGGEIAGALMAVERMMGRM